MTINRRDALKSLAVGAAAVAVLPRPAGAGTDRVPRPAPGRSLHRRRSGPPPRRLRSRGFRSGRGAAGAAEPHRAGRVSLTTGGNPAARPADHGRRRTTVCWARSSRRTASPSPCRSVPSLFDARFGLAARKPRTLTPMGVFPRRRARPGLVPRRPAAADLRRQRGQHRAPRAAGTSPGAFAATLQPRYRLAGFLSPPRPDGTQRNLMGFKDGTNQPGGVRRHRPDLDRRRHRAGLGHRRHLSGPAVHPDAHRILGPGVTCASRRASSGGGATPGLRSMAYARRTSPTTSATRPAPSPPLDAHTRLANPRTTATAQSRLLRRGYNYDSGFRPSGDLDAGLIFCGYQQDLRRQFETVQRRLADDSAQRLHPAVGGGYFFALPGVTSTSDWYGRALLT